MWTYDDALTTPKDRVRFIIQDVDETDQLLSDEGVGIYLPGGALGQASETLAAASAARAIGTKFARRAMSISEGGASTNWGDRSKRYFDLAVTLETQGEEIDATGLFDWSEQVIDDFSARERFRDQIIREAIP